MSTRDTLYGFATLLALAAVTGSLVAQFMFDLAPCPLCIAQRLLYLLAAVVLLFGLWRKGARPIMTLLGVASGLGAFAVSLYQGWIASEETLGQCGAPGPFESTLWWLAENISYPLFAPEASCADAAGHMFLGFTMPFWSLLCGICLAALLVGSMVFARKGA